MTRKRNCAGRMANLHAGNTLRLVSFWFLLLLTTGVAVLLAPAAERGASRVSSVELAADTETLQIWDPETPFPPYNEMPDLRSVTHVQVERAEKGGYHYLHEPAIAWHKGTLYAGWANHRLFEINVKDELLRGRESRDGGLTWSPAQTWAAAPLLGGEAFNHPVLFSHQGKLWGFFTRWEKELPRTEIFFLADATRTWEPAGSHIPGFLPFTPPRKLSDGNWIMGGELHWYEAAVAISRGDDFTQWTVVKIPRPDNIKLEFPETTLMEQDGALVAICRPKEGRTAPAAVSKDNGQTWTPLRPSNFPLAPSKPLCGKLSTGQQYLITDNLEQGRTLLSIALTAPGGQRFCRIWKICHQQTPKRRLLAGQDGKSMAGRDTEWSYPAAVEHDGKLYVICTQGKEDCALSIIPLSALEVGPSAFQTRGVVLTPADLSLGDWPERAAKAGLTTVALHLAPSIVEKCFDSSEGKAFIEKCTRLGLDVEYELHAVGELLPRALFASEPECFRMDEKGARNPDVNLCVHSTRALEIAASNAVRIAQKLKPTTGRYYYWGDDGAGWCQCPKCRDYTDSEQALILENYLLGELRKIDPRATLSHIAYARTIAAPKKVKPAPGIFLEFAPISRNYTTPFSQQTDLRFNDSLKSLEDNLKVFPVETAQVLEYWLDVSLFSKWKRPAVKLPWRPDVMRADVQSYAKLGIRNVTTFAVYIDADYIKMHGEPAAIQEYGDILRSTPPAAARTYSATRGAAGAVLLDGKLDDTVPAAEAQATRK